MTDPANPPEHGLSGEGAKKRLPVMIATPMRHFRGHQDIPPQIAKALRELHERRAEHDYSFEFAAACGGLCSARNRLVHDFLHKSDCQILRWWDADLHDQEGKDADHILRQLTVARKNGAHVLGSLYCKREKRPRWVANWLNNAEVQPDGLVQCAELGGGGEMISRVAFEELRRIYVEIPRQDAEHGAKPLEYRDRETGEMITAFYQIQVIDGDLLSEDFFLNYLMRCVQMPIWADTVARYRQLDDGQLYPARDQAWPPIPAMEAK